MAFLETLALINAGVGTFNTLFGEDERSSKMNKAIKALLKRGKEGFGDGTINKLKQSRKNLAGNEISATRASAASRLQRQGVPIQIQEQILRDMSGEGLGQLGGILNEIDFANEREKRLSFSQAGNLAMGLQGAPQGQGIGQSLGMAFSNGNPFADLFGGGNNQQTDEDQFGQDFKKRFYGGF